MAILRGTGVGTDMGDVTDPASPCRLFIDSDRFYLSSLRVKFNDSGSDTGVADLAIKVDNRRGADFNYTLETIPDLGVGQASPGGEIAWQIEPGQIPAYTIARGDEYVLDWTNPGSDTQEWAYEAEVLPA